MSKYIDVYINQKSQFVSTSSHKYQLSWFLLNVQGTHATHVIDEARTQLVQSHVLLHLAYIGEYHLGILVTILTQVTQ